jgi:hypothetical protein
VVVPDLGIVEEVEGDHLDAPISWCAAEAKVPLTTVEPQKGIAHTIEFRKFNFVRHLDPIDGMILVALRTLTPSSVMRPLHLLFKADEGHLVLFAGP